MFTSEQITAGVIEAIVSAAFFIVLWNLLGLRVFKPFFAMLEERESKTSGAERTVATKREELRALQRQLDDSLRSARVEGLQLRENLLKEGQREGQALIDRAIEMAEQELSRARSEMEKVRENALRDLERESRQLAKLLAERATQTPQGPVLH